MTVRPITGRSVVVTGTGPPRRRARRRPRGARRRRAAARLRVRVGGRRASTAVADADGRLGGIDQIVHTWLAPGVVAPHRFVDLDEDEWASGCERSLAAAWWMARAERRAVAGEQGEPGVRRADGRHGRRRRVHDARRGRRRRSRVLAKGCGRQWGADGVTVNTIAAAPHHWVDADTADALIARDLAVDARVRAAPATWPTTSRRWSPCSTIPTRTSSPPAPSSPTAAPGWGCERRCSTAARSS